MASTDPVAPPSPSLAPPTDKLILLSTYRFAVLHNVESCGKRVYVDTNGTLLCPHGETGAIIKNWVAREEAGVAVNRNSTCTCRDTNGLSRAIHRHPPEAPSSVHAYLLQNENAKTILRRHHPAVELPFHTGVYLAHNGEICCGHGKTNRMDHKKCSIERCACEVPLLPPRKGRPQMGSVGKKLIGKRARLLAVGGVV